MSNEQALLIMQTITGEQLDALAKISESFTIIALVVVILIDVMITIIDNIHDKKRNMKNNDTK